MGELYNISKYIYSIARLGSGTATNCFKRDYCKRVFLTNLDGGVMNFHAVVVLCFAWLFRLLYNNMLAIYYAFFLLPLGSLINDVV